MRPTGGFERYRVGDGPRSGSPANHENRPLPNGGVHLGNLRTFLINWAMARREGWKIVLRIEDLDGPRVKPGSIEQCIDLLSWVGIDWDEGPLIQSEDLGPYERAMSALARAGVVYPCELTRSEIEAAASAPQEGSGELRYPPELRPELMAQVRRRRDELALRGERCSGPVHRPLRR
ncbi:glutamate--tRNA ligase family protein [Phycisphaerales bacterium ac7]